MGRRWWQRGTGLLLGAVLVGSALGVGLPSGPASALGLRGIGTRIEMATRGDTLVDWFHDNRWETLTMVNYSGITEGHAYSVVVGGNSLDLNLRCRSAPNSRWHSLPLHFHNPILGTPEVNGLKPDLPAGHGEVSLAEGSSASGGTREVKVTVQRKNDDTYHENDVKETKSFLIRVTSCA